jgi:signal transduction histidine kinase
MRAGLAMSALSAAGWLTMDILAGHEWSHPLYQYWELLIKLSTFALFTVVFAELKRALARSDDRLIKVLEGLDAAVCVLDPAADAVLYRNRRFESVFGDGAWSTGAQPIRRLLDAERDPAVTAGDGSVIPFEGRWFLVQRRELHWTDGRPVVLLSATDITARRIAEESSRVQQERLQATARLVTIGEIASSIAHELNQPLAAIGNYVSGSLRRLRAGADPGTVVGALEQAGQQAERAGDIIRRVRDFLRSRESAYAPADLNAIVSRATALAAPEAERAGVELALHLDPSLATARADSVLIEQVVINLVRNAIDATRNASGRARLVEIATASADDGTLRVSVGDAGPGLTAEVAERLFEPFFTTKPDGLGLGLNICRSIVELHGGRVWATPRPKGGAEFHFTLRTVA